MILVYFNKSPGELKKLKHEIISGTETLNFPLCFFFIELPLIANLFMCTKYCTENMYNYNVIINKVSYHNQFTKNNIVCHSSTETKNTKEK